MTINRGTLVEYMQSKLGLENAEIGDEQPLFTSGVLDSFSMVDLVMMLEKECGFRMSPGEVNLDNLDSISRILAFVGEKLA